MTTQKQIDANRRNATKSTGPRTAEGKSTARFNALRHGIFAEAPVVKGEDPDAFNTLRDSYLDRFLPATPEEQALVGNLINHTWFLGRFAKIESHMWNLRIEGSPTSTQYFFAPVYAFVFEQLGYLQRRIDSAERHFRHDLELLLKLQAARKKAAPPAEPISQPESTEPLKPENGFVPAKSFSGVAPPPTPANLPANSPQKSPSPVPAAVCDTFNPIGPGTDPGRAS